MKNATRVREPVDKSLLQMYLKQNSIQYYNLAEENGVYVYNTVKNEETGKPVGVLLTIGEGTVSIPATVAPIDLCKYASKADILSSKSFITALNKGILAIVSEQEAIKVLSTDDMIREMKRITKMEAAELNKTDSPVEVAKDVAEVTKSIASASLEVVEAIDRLSTEGIHAVTDALMDQKMYFTDYDKMFIKEKLSTVQGGFDSLKKLGLSD